jgi:hypothetical protein
VERELAEVIAAFHEDIKGAELHLVIVQAGVKRTEIRNPVDAQDHSLAVEHEALLPGGFHDPGISARPVIAVS